MKERNAEIESHVAGLHAALCNIVTVLGGDPLELEDNEVVRLAHELATAAKAVRREARRELRALEWLGFEGFVCHVADGECIADRGRAGAETVTHRGESWSEIAAALGIEVE